MLFTTDLPDLFLYHLDSGSIELSSFDKEPKIVQGMSSIGSGGVESSVFGWFCSSWVGSFRSKSLMIPPHDLQR
jgi:hypothetical protein